MSILKQQAGEAAAALVQPGMIVGLGTGSTAIFATRRIAERLRTADLTDIVAIATSKATEAAARELGIPLMADDLPRTVDLTIDGADEVDPDLNLIKGAGGALLREKIVAQASTREIIVVDDSKLSPRLGTNSALPIEVIEFGLSSHIRFLEALGARVVPRKAGDALFRTDSGNIILDSHFGPIADVHALSQQLGARSGIVEHGLFLGIAQDVFVAGRDGVRHLRRP
ncbi:ribose-5-phosphate isomerase RpiA [Rhodopila sp.]|uniref:ribose-5-phosphate isomerase RpiA n=1 Tax=Rhodopila sp. TaxID=2480087 RepID=UPI002CB1349F|nr:ribose-5-phosphate isomerase RpiA [Rhodopila sp.]HVZ09981.1 ribose-5-phosphate isomerase RpiA [Rhodopila sp.]